MKKKIQRSIRRLGLNQVSNVDPYALSAHRHYRWFRPNYPIYRIVSSQKPLTLRNSYAMLPHFHPGQEVWVIVQDNDNPRRGCKIIKDVIEEVYSFGVGQKGALKEYWLRHARGSSGIEADDIYTSYNQAKFFLHY